MGVSRVEKGELSHRDEATIQAAPSKSLAPYSLFVVSYSQAMKGESLLLASGVSCALMSLPRSIGSGCGVCLRVPRHDRHRAEDILSVAGVAVSAVHDFTFGPLHGGGGG